MGNNFLLLLLSLAAIAVVLREDFVLTLVYLLVGAYAIGRWWSRRALNAVRFTRRFQRRALLEERVPVQLDIVNAHWLPIAWMQLTDRLPIELIAPNWFRCAITIGPWGRQHFNYTLYATRRGYYRIGPLHLRSGDLVGLSDELTNEGDADYLTVYPKIIALTQVPLPSRSPLGTLRHTQPIFEDPARVRGKRDYVAGDSLRRIDWKATAAIGRLQVKQFEPSIAVETAIVLNLNADEYDYHTRSEAIELAIVIAASLANWIVAQRQPVGLYANGTDPIGAGGRPQRLPPRKGRAQLTRILDVLARIRAAEAAPLVQLLQRETPHLPWGTTLIVITGVVDDDAFHAIFRARQAGLNVILNLVGMVPTAAAIRQRARHFDIPLYEFGNERDLAVWRQ
jgi:uncharacterized protein (DUF58 family)